MRRLPGQIFKGEIHGIENLEKLKDIFGEKFLAWLGKSRNTEYGKVEIQLSEIIELDTDILDRKIWNMKIMSC